MLFMRSPLVVMSLRVNLDALSALSVDDGRRFVEYGFGETQTSPFDCVHRAFEHYAAVQPHVVAIEHLGQSITYKELDEQANRLAHRLRSHGLRPGLRACLLVQRSIPMVVGIVAIMKAGGAYVPLDGGIVTDSTLEHVIKDSQAVIALSLRDFAHRITQVPVLCLEDVILQDLRLGGDSSKPVDLSCPRDGVYVIYTSGEFLRSF